MNWVALIGKGWHVRAWELGVWTHHAVANDTNFMDILMGKFESSTSFTTCWCWSCGACWARLVLYLGLLGSRSHLCLVSSGSCNFFSGAWSGGSCLGSSRDSWLLLSLSLLHLLHHGCHGVCLLLTWSSSLCSWLAHVPHHLLDHVVHGVWLTWCCWLSNSHALHHLIDLVHVGHLETGR